MSKILTFFKSPVMDANGSPLILDNGKRATVWAVTWRAFVFAAVLVASLRAFLFLLCLASYLDAA